MNTKTISVEKPKANPQNVDRILYIHQKGLADNVRFLVNKLKNTYGIECNIGIKKADIADQDGLLIKLSHVSIKKGKPKSKDLLFMKLSPVPDNVTEILKRFTLINNVRIRLVK